ncbi:hypothetical protein [Candidatus Nitrosacidococcus sp. I8]|uniref:hypothetical protein n=1 Tax=Candidatus Nitrosacidococcus sp. I8 TaxID=2942908 RepID=UPI002225C88B|nr:hypothetical protein [Candidatus Nitrosacidococcus sp. I8]CAH9018415.1 hypothetical protein NURINAE_00910 [Candidatus Nitrosacidococcus sp. I8]
MKKINKFTQRSLSIIGLVGLVTGFFTGFLPTVNAEDTTVPTPDTTVPTLPAPTTTITPISASPLTPGSHVAHFKSLPVYATIRITDNSLRYAPIMGTVDDSDQDEQYKSALGYDGDHCTPLSLSITSQNLAQNADNDVAITLFGGATPNALNTITVGLPDTGTVNSNSTPFSCTIPLGGNSCTFSTNSPEATHLTGVNFLAFQILNPPNDSTRIYTTLKSQCDIKYSLP